MKIRFSYIMFLITLILLALVFIPKAQAASNIFYSVALSTPITDVGNITWKGAKTPNINLSHLYPKQIWIHNYNSTTTVVVEVYKNATSSTAASIVLRYVVPGTPGTYTVFPTIRSNVITNADMYDAPYLGIGILPETATESGAKGNAPLGTWKATIEYMIP